MSRWLDCQLCVGVLPSRSIGKSTTQAMLLQAWALAPLDKWGRLAAVIIGLAAGLSPKLHAVIFYSTADPNYNTTAPTGLLANSGWQWTGQWGGFQGTPISPHYFITARHVGGAVGEPFVLGDVSYTTTAFFDDTESDLRIWQVSGTFPSWAPIYRATNEVGRRLVVFGRGLTRGAEVRDSATNTLHGWKWGSGDGKMRWGQNAVVAVVNRGAWGSLLYAVFNPAGGNNVAHLAQGDSSGPVFIHDGIGWKLAGVAAIVDSAFNTTDAGEGFNAALFDIRGLYVGKGNNWKLISGPSPVLSGFYASRISVHTAWIDSVISANEVTAAPHLSRPETEGGVQQAEESRVAARDTGWKPPQRYRMMLTLAALGDLKKQLQLGTALLQESDDAAKAEGLKWLEIAAAHGCRDAEELLMLNRDLLMRSDRDRDKVRVSRCCPVPGR